jgi:hypothetical protein
MSFPSGRSSVRKEQLGSHWTDLYEILYLSIFRKLEILYLSIFRKLEILYFSIFRKPEILYLSIFRKPV